MKDKKNSTYKTIGEVAEILNLINKKNCKLITHTIRFWEKEFRQIKPKIFSGKRRYYDEGTVNKLKEIKYLLKDKGLTIKGAKKFLNKEKHSMSRIETKFKELKTKNMSAFITFLMAGDPSIEESETLFKNLPKLGVDIIEIGMPFTDPMADGLLIQKAGQRLSLIHI